MDSTARDTTAKALTAFFADAVKTRCCAELSDVPPSLRVIYWGLIRALCLQMKRAGVCTRMAVRAGNDLVEKAATHFVARVSHALKERKFPNTTTLDQLFVPTARLDDLTEVILSVLDKHDTLRDCADNTIHKLTSPTAMWCAVVSATERATPKDVEAIVVNSDSDDDEEKKKKKKEHGGGFSVDAGDAELPMADDAPACGGGAAAEEEPKQPRSEERV